MKKKYLTFLLKESECIKDSDITNHSFFFESEFNESLNCTIAKAISNGKTVRVFYYSNTIEERMVAKYHQDSYPSVPMFSIYKNKNNGYLLKNFWEGTLSGYFLKTYHDDGKSKISQDFNQDFELTEYRVYQYNDAGEEVGIKIFYPDSWTIHEEDSIM